MVQEKKGIGGYPPSKEGDPVEPGRIKKIAVDDGVDPLGKILAAMAARTKSTTTGTTPQQGHAIHLTPLRNRVVSVMATGEVPPPPKHHTVAELFWEDKLLQKIMHSLRDDNGIKFENVLMRIGFFTISGPEDCIDGFVQAIFYRILATFITNLKYYVNLDDISLAETQEKSKELSLIAEHAIAKALEYRKVAYDDAEGLEGNFRLSIRGFTSDLEILQTYIEKLSTEVAPAIRGNESRVQATYV